MKRFSFFFCVLLLFACHKEADTVYDSHLFAEVAAHTWVFDSNNIVKADNTDSSRYPIDTLEETADFSSQQYIIRLLSDTAIVDSTTYQAIFDNPSKIYYYPPGGLLIPQQYFVIDTVNSEHLVLQQHDTTTNLSSVLYYHAKP